MIGFKIAKNVKSQLFFLFVPDSFVFYNFVPIFFSSFLKKMQFLFYHSFLYFWTKKKFRTFTFVHISENLSHTLFFLPSICLFVLFSLLLKINTKRIFNIKTFFCKWLLSSFLYSSRQKNKLKFIKQTNEYLFNQNWQLLNVNQKKI